MTMQIRIGIPSVILRGAVPCALLLFACAPKARPPEAVPVVPQLLPLELDGGLADTEFSSICWWGDDLLILPQFPHTSERTVLALARDSLARAVGEIEAGRPVTPLRPRQIPTDSGDVPAKIRDYDGLEALSIVGDRCYAVAEYGEGGDAWGSMLVAGSLEEDDGGIRFERIAKATLEGPQVRENFTHEALVLAGDEVWVICELNGRNVVDHPVLARYTADLEPLGSLPMPALEFRVTDATDLDAENRFWVLNLFWPPDAAIVNPYVNPGPVERLVPLRYTGDAIERDASRPVLDLRGGGDHPMHNWEGVARWGEEGFLLVTDSYPENLLAYVALPD